MQASQAEGVPASPPTAVSRREAGSDAPTDLRAETTSSNGSGFSTPERASCAALTALATPMALRFWQGYSTSPRTGSQTRPSRLPIAVEAASRASSGVPPRSSTRAAAAIAEADPTSAWQPPSAPETEALRARRAPTALAHHRASTTCSSVAPTASPTARRQPGTTPADPAVGAATITPIVAERSRTAIA